MSDHDPFLTMIFANPFDDGPRLVYADWLEEQGDPRGELLRLWGQIASTAPNLDPLHVSSSATWNDRWQAVCKLRGVRLKRVFMAAQALYTPLHSGRRLQVLITDDRSRRAVVAGLLRAFNLISNDDRHFHWKEAWAVQQEKTKTAKQKHGPDWEYRQWRWQRYGLSAAAAAVAVAAAATATATTADATVAAAAAAVAAVDAAAAAADAAVAAVDAAAAAADVVVEPQAVRWQIHLARWLNGRDRVAVRLRELLDQLDAAIDSGSHPRRE